MDHELKELLKELNEVLEDLLDDNKDELNEKAKGLFKRAFKQKAVISIEKKEDGTAETHIEGSTLAILVTLAALEQTVLEKLKVPSKVFDDIKHITGVRENKNHE